MLCDHIDNAGPEMLYLFFYRAFEIVSTMKNSSLH